MKEAGLYIINESPMIGYPKKIKKTKDKIRMECVLQTVGDMNRNKRIYDKHTLQESINSLSERIENGEFLGELDHPLDSNPTRQITVLYKEASHKFCETGWDGNKLVSIIETLAATENGRVLRDLVAKDKVPVGFSYRGMGNLQQIFESGQRCFKVTGPLQTITWDAVSYPSHKEAKLVKVTEGVSNAIHESININNIITESNGVICTEDGMCFLPNDYDRYIEERVNNLVNKFSR